MSFSVGGSLILVITQVYKFEEIQEQIIVKPGYLKKSNNHQVS